MAPRKSAVKSGKKPAAKKSVSKPLADLGPKARYTDAVRGGEVRPRVREL